MLSDLDVNRFLPWFTLKSVDEAEAFYFKIREQIEAGGFFKAICLKGKDVPIGYIDLAGGNAHDFGYALKKEFWRRGIVTEAGIAFIGFLKAKLDLPYITATHDVLNPNSGRVMQKLGLSYRYSYREQWQPKNLSVIFRMYQLDLKEGNGSFAGYRQKYGGFIEKDI